MFCCILFPQGRDHGSSLHLPGLGPFRLQFYLGWKKHFCVGTYPCCGSRHQGKVGVGASMEVSHDAGSHFFSPAGTEKTTLLWSQIFVGGLEFGVGGGAVLGISWADAQDAWGRPASPTNQSSKLQGFYQREQLGEVVCSHLRNGFCHWWLDTGWRKRNLTIRNERSLIWIC